MVRKKRSAKKTAVKGRAKHKHQIDDKIGRGYRAIKKSHWLRRIKYLQQSGKPLLPKLTFSRLFRECLQTARPHNSFRVQEKALRVAQIGVEAAAVSLFESANICALHAKRSTLLPTDIRLCTRIAEKNTGSTLCFKEQQLSYYDEPPRAPVPNGSKRVKAPATTSPPVQEQQVSEEEVPPTPERSDPERSDSLALPERYAEGAESVENDEEQRIPVRTPSTLKSPPQIQRVVSLHHQCSLQNLFK